MKTVLHSLFLVTLALIFSSCNVLDSFEQKAAKINGYEKAAYHLAKENRKLKVEISHLKSELQTLKSKNNYLRIQVDKYEKPQTLKSREIASVRPVDLKNDLVKFDVYQWKPSQMIAIGASEFEKKNYEKSAQFYHSFVTRFPSHEKVDDKLLFQAGVAAFESNAHPEWTKRHLQTLVENYPTSKFYRGAKLWMALTHLKEGNEDYFFNVVEEFRKKYRNTDEWKVLSHHYEKIVHKYKRN